ncbi:flagellar FlbD family protein [Chitinispirillales bacterium ANBcel5]|uniref:flagellar FlbD family protein n=1 Tax=Cellulosispirillum alkaliphilum TaxID=3039283 RepID=UPI002A520C35|nr:flagellar FlbD family protein [Chitinispirillales bacterium ANBcel5]
MVALIRLNGQEFVLNADLIESIELTPDTMVTLTNGRKILVKNSIEEVVRKVIKYKQLCNSALQVINREEKE